MPRREFHGPRGELLPGPLWGLLPYWREGLLIYWREEQLIYWREERWRLQYLCYWRIGSCLLSAAKAPVAESTGAPVIQFVSALGAATAVAS